MASYLNIVIKCPICGETKRITHQGQVRIDGIDPLMEKYECKYRKPIYGEGDDWLKLLGYDECNTVFYIAPNKKLTQSQKKQASQR